MRFWLMESSVCLSNRGPSSLGCTVSYTFSRWLLATLIESRPLFKWRRFFLHLLLMTSCTFSCLVNPLHLAAPLLTPSVEGFSMLLLRRSHFIIFPFQLHFFLSFRSIAYFPLSTRERRFLCIQSRTPCALGLLVTFLHLVAPLFEILVDGIFSLLVKPQPLFTLLHRFLHLQLMATCNFDRIATSLQALLLAHSVHDLMHIYSACEPSPLGSTASYACSRRRRQYASSAAGPLV